MSVSRHPIALRLEQYSSASTRLLALVMALPLIDGLFPALILAGALDTPVGILQVGLLIFGGSATVAVILTDIPTDRRKTVKSVLLVGAGLMVLAAIEASLAPSIASVLNLDIFTRFAALVIATVAAKTASAHVGEYLPNSGTIIALGFVASFSPANAEFILNVEPVLLGRAVAAAGVGTAFALFLAVFAHHLRAVVDIDRLRFGSSIALGTLALSIVSLAPETAAVVVLLVAGVLSLSPSSTGALGRTRRVETDGGQTTTPGDECSCGREL